MTSEAGAKDLKPTRSKQSMNDETNNLKAFRYEEAHEGVPPVTVKAVSSSSGSPKTPVVQGSNKFEQTPHSQRPVTSATTASSSRNSPHATADIKRDSAFAPSVSTTAARTSYAESHHSSVAGGVAKEPSLPTIVVQDDEPSPSPPPAPPVPVAPTVEQRSRSPFSLKRSKENSNSNNKQVMKARSAEPLHQASEMAFKHDEKKTGSGSEGFKGIQSEIPSGTLDGLDLADLVSDKVDFSKRGSLLFGGKKMYPASSASESPVVGLGSDGVGQASSAVSGRISRAGENVDLRSEAATKPADSSRPGLQAGRRKPSVQMLQATMQGGRVLSAEETSFSMKVRSMYECGDERAGQWAPAMIPEGMAKSNGTPDTSIDEILNASGSPEQRSEQQQQQHPALRAPTPLDVRASYVKESNELAGGIEDWDEVNGEDVDRYGFISPKPDHSRNSIIEGGPHRVATSLRFESQQPRRSRKLQRRPSTSAHSSKSVPSQQTQSKDSTSVRSFRSHKSAGNHPHSGNPFRSKNRRTVAEASEMLTLPPGLEDIHEQDSPHNTPAATNSSASSSTTAAALTALKRRERSREEKWQKMAHPLRNLSSSTQGGGMAFTFDTTDSKLISRVWKGIPDRWRATSWHSFLTTSAKKRNLYVADESLIATFHSLQDLPSADDVQIDMDVPRTINMHIMFRRRYRGGQRLLFHVLHAISLFFPDTGYVQGMASLAATLLCYYDEEHAFVMLVRLWQLRGLDKLYQAGFAGLMGALREFEREWLAGGDVAARLEELGVDITAYATRWYLTLFNLSVPFPAQLRVWDVFMLLGDAGPPFATSSSSTTTTSMNASSEKVAEKVDDKRDDGTGFGGADLDVLHAASAALIDATREIVLDSDFENAMKVLTSFVPIRDEDLFMRVAKAEWRMRKKRGPTAAAAAAAAAPAEVGGKTG